eukprot:TRINITY_DN7812_c0_g1_i1.p1 TRINITY_DN7812_c0_g1~~TRINITY_DN7812_c0_g1_i1.p1  ORF type:complete len:328 (+),score=105.94 TRINITY_DN7812_c0_g1_i1:68-1051(+)
MADEVNKLKSLSDEDYAKLMGLPGVMDQLVEHVMSARAPNPIEEIYEWANQKLREKRQWENVKRSQNRGSQMAAADAAVNAGKAGFLPALKTSSFFTTIDRAVASAMGRALDDLSAYGTILRQRGAVDFLEVMTAARVVLMTDADVLYPLVDRDFDYAATNHQLYQVGGQLLKQVTDLRRLLASHNKVQTMTNWDAVGNATTDEVGVNNENLTLNARFVQDLRAFASSYTAHSVHKSVVVADTFLKLQEDEQRQALRILLSLNIGTGTLLKVVVKELLAMDVPYEQLRDFIRAVRHNAENVSYNAVLHAAVEPSPMHLNLLEGDQLM